MQQPESAPENSPVTNGRDRRPLYLRMYFQAHMTELVQLVGYRDWSNADLLQRLQPLFDRHGTEAVRQAADEVLHFDRSRKPPVVRLTDAARQLAVGLLGKPKPVQELPPAVNSQSSNVVPPAEREVASTPVHAKRELVIRKMLEWLHEHEPNHFLTADVAQENWPRVDLRLVDVVVSRPGEQLLLALRKSLTKRQHASLLDTAASLDCVAVRVWPDLGPDREWVWRKYPVRAKETPPVPNNASTSS